MLLQLAIGDAYGFCFEWATPTFVAKNNNGKQYGPHTGNKPATGVYSDDTQMTLGLAEFLLSGQPCTPLNLTRHFLDAFKRDPRDGYARRFHTLLTEVATPEEFLARIVPMSNRAGGAMRASPCGLLPSAEEVRDMAMWQASLTHATKAGMDSAAAAALMVWACRQECDPMGVAYFLNDMVPGYDWHEPWEGPVGNLGVEAVQAAITALATSDSLSEILVNSVAFTGDVDTVAAISMAAASFLPASRMKADIHSNLYRGLETGPYGWSYLKKLDAALLAAFPLPVAEPEVVEVAEVVVGTPDSDNLIADLFGSN